MIFLGKRKTKVYRSNTIQCSLAHESNVNLTLYKNVHDKRTTLCIYESNRYCPIVEIRHKTQFPNAESLLGAYRQEQILIRSLEEAILSKLSLMEEVTSLLNGF